MSRYDAFREAFRRAMTTLPSRRNKGSVRPIKAITPRRLDVRVGGALGMEGFTSRRFDVQCWEDEKGIWHYDGPANTGPRHVRTAGRGPYWRGEVTRQFVVTLRDRIRQIEQER